MMIHERKGVRRQSARKVWVGQCRTSQPTDLLTISSDLTNSILGAEIIWEAHESVYISSLSRGSLDVLVSDPTHCDFKIIFFIPYCHTELLVMIT